jgi:hypothetical protein
VFEVLLNIRFTLKVNLGFPGLFIYAKGRVGGVASSREQDHGRSDKAAKDQTDDEPAQRAPAPTEQLQIPKAPPHSEWVIPPAAGFVSSEHAFGCVHSSGGD